MSDKPELYNIEELQKVAKWFYKGDGSKKRLSKKEIAKRLGIEVRGVTRRLDRALKDGIFRVEIPETADCGAGPELQRIFPSLREIITVPAAEDEDYASLLSAWGSKAAGYFDKLTHLRGQHHVGISGGESLLSFCEAVSSRPRENVHIHTTALIGRGELAPTASHVDPIVTASILWSKCGRIPGHCHYATVPPYYAIDRDGIRQELEQLAVRQPIREVIKRMDDITIAFVGLGQVVPPPPDELPP
jgi:DNA-binding transcriptional regulator LsrR (DeoR family)